MLKVLIQLRHILCDDDENTAINMKAEEKKNLRGMIGENVQSSNTLLLSVQTTKNSI